MARSSAVPHSFRQNLRKAIWYMARRTRKTTKSEDRETQYDTGGGGHLTTVTSGPRTYRIISRYYAIHLDERLKSKL